MNIPFVITTPVFGTKKVCREMNIIKTTINIGAGAPFRVIHISDTHLTYADMRDGERKVKLADSRKKYFTKAELALLEKIIACAKHEKPYVLNAEEIRMMQRILTNYTKPQITKKQKENA